MNTIKPLIKINLSEAIIITAVILFILGGIMIFVPMATPHIAITLAIIFLLIYGIFKKVKYHEMQESMVVSVNTGMSAIYLFFFIGFFYSGFAAQNVSENVVNLISRGGLSSMFFTITIVILALSLGGLMFSLGIVSVILDKMTKYLVTPFKATLFVALTAVGINYIV